MSVNTRTSLWPSRWPAIALQECIDEVEAAPEDEQQEVKWNLPCNTCEAATSCLNAKRKEQGPLLYSREMLTHPRTSDASLFPFELFDPLLDRELEMVSHYEKPSTRANKLGVATAWDIAWSEKTGGDWLVKMTGVIDRETGLQTVLDIGRWQRLSFDEQVKLIESEHARYNDDVVVIEGDFAQIVWRQHLLSTTRMPVLSHASNSKRDLQDGVPGLLIDLETKRWRFPYKKGSRNHENMEVFLSECESFGWVDGRLQGIGEHDDTVMCWWHLAWGLQRVGLTAKVRRPTRRVPG